MRSIWYRGVVTRFDEHLIQILECDREYAEKIRESWVDAGLLAYDRQGLLCWRSGGGF